MAGLFPVTPANAPPASYADFTNAQRSLYDAGMLPSFNVAVGPQLPGGTQEAARGAALSALPGMPPPSSPWNATKVPFNPGHRPATPAPIAPAGAPPETRGAPAYLTGGAAPETSSPIAAPIAPVAPNAPTTPAAPNFVGMGIPPHPADYATWYAGKLAENMQGGAEAGPQGGQGLHFIGPESPRMEAPAGRAAVNVIRGGMPSIGGEGGNLMTYAAQQPEREAALKARLDPAIGAKQAMALDSQRQLALNTDLSSGDPVKVANAQRGLAYYKTDAYKNAYMQRLLLMGLPAAEANMIISNIK